MWGMVQCHARRPPAAARARARRQGGHRRPPLAPDVCRSRPPGPPRGRWPAASRPHIRRRHLHPDAELGRVAHRALCGDQDRRRHQLDRGHVSPQRGGLHPGLRGDGADADPGHVPGLLAHRHAGRALAQARTPPPRPGDRGPCAARDALVPGAPRDPLGRPLLTRRSRRPAPGSEPRGDPHVHLRHRGESQGRDAYPQHPGHRHAASEGELRPEHGRRGLHGLAHRAHDRLDRRGAAARDVRHDDRLAGALEPRSRGGADRPRGMHVHGLRDAVSPRIDARAQRQPRHAQDVPALRLRGGTHPARADQARRGRARLPRLRPLRLVRGPRQQRHHDHRRPRQAIRHGRTDPPRRRGAPGRSRHGGAEKPGGRRRATGQNARAVRGVLQRPRAHQRGLQSRPLVQHGRPLRAGCGALRQRRRTQEGHDHPRWRQYQRPRDRGAPVHPPQGAERRLCRDA